MPRKKPVRELASVVVKWYLGTCNEARERWAAIPSVMRGDEDSVPGLKPPGALWDRTEGCYVLGHDPTSLERFVAWAAGRKDAVRQVEHSKLLSELLERHQL